MSFSSDIKEEILSKSKKETKHCCVSAEKFGELLTDVALKSELKEEYSEYMDISKLSECCIKSILKGAFLASGYIIDPLNDYHFEIDFKNKACAEYIFNLLSVLEFTPKLLKRKNSNSYIIYFKDSEQISLFLGIIGANKALLLFENVRVEKEVKNNINRNINCETANLNKVLNASVEQINAIKKLKENGNFEKLDDNLKEIAILRLENPDMSLIELGKKLTIPVGKSGVNYRLKKIVKLAEE